ncbi:MAG: precorrin-6A reductase [Arenibacterium sp.]
MRRLWRDVKLVAMVLNDGVSKHLLLLAGSGEARDIAARLTRWPDVRVTVSQLYESRTGLAFAQPTRLGGFGGAEGFEAFMREAGIDAVLDAAHPFAVRVGARASRYCAKHGLAYARVLRPPWEAKAGDNWHEVPDEATARAALRAGQRVFTTTGLSGIDTLTADPAIQFFVRRLRDDPVPDMPSHISFVHGVGPFSKEDEIATLRDLKIDVLIVKNSGGTASATKLEAARALDLPVILLARPKQPDGRVLNSVAEALDWVAAL